MDILSRLSATTFPFIKLPLEQTLDIVAKAGFRNVDLIGKVPHLSLNPAECDPKAVLDAASKRGMKIANLATYVGAGFASEDPKEQQKEYDDTIRAIDIAAVLGSRTVRGFRSPKYDHAKDIPRIAPLIKKCADYAGARNIYLCLENHGGEISGVPEKCRELCEKVGSPFFGVLYDPCNLLTKGADYRTGFDVMKEHIVHVHIKDGTKENASQKSTMLGQGLVDTKWVVQKLEGIGYKGHYALEYEVETVPADTGLKQWYDTFRRVVGV